MVKEVVEYFKLLFEIIGSFLLDLLYFPWTFADPIVFLALLLEEYDEVTLPPEPLVLNEPDQPYPWRIERTTASC